MKRLTLAGFVLAAGLLLGGCATGRVALVDLDMRDKDQIQAFYPESTIPYAVPQNSAPATAAITPVPWQFIFDFLKVAKMRLRICSVEWRM